MLCARYFYDVGAMITPLYRPLAGQIIWSGRVGVWTQVSRTGEPPLWTSTPQAGLMGPQEKAPLCCLPRHSLKVIAPTMVSVPAVFISFLNTSLSLASCIHHCTEVAYLELNSDFFAKSGNLFSLHFPQPHLPLTQPTILFLKHSLVCFWVACYLCLMFFWL